jgi:hypothetical protein
MCVVPPDTPEAFLASVPVVYRSCWLLQTALLLVVWCVRVPGVRIPEVLPLRGKWLRRLLTGLILAAPVILLALEWPRLTSGYYATCCR